MGERGASRFSVGKPEGNNHLEDLVIDGRIRLNLIFNKQDGSGLD
jgi:hypothetical protein